MYKAVIARVKTRPHPNADRLQLGMIAGEQVIVGLETKDGELMAYFPADGQLALGFAEANDLISRTNPTTGAREGGYFAKNCRVRAQKLRGEKSEGFACELAKLTAAGVSQETVSGLKEGDEFVELDDIEICRKFIAPATREAQANRAKKSAKKNPMFKEHLDTGHFHRDLGKIPDGALLWVTEKLHGTSARYSLCKDIVEKPKSWFRKLLRMEPKTEAGWFRYVGTRRTSWKLGESKSDGYYGTHAFREDFMHDVWHLLKKGETLYGEIVGYTNGLSPVMNSPATKDIGDKGFIKKYGERIVYTYGCAPAEHRFFIYRITQTNEDGYAVDLSWPQVKTRSAELGLPHVPELAPPFYYTRDKMRELEELVAPLVDGESTLDSRHIREGVVIRIEKGAEIHALKNKSFDFKVLEGLAKDSGQVDLEEAEEASA